MSPLIKHGRAIMAVDRLPSVQARLDTPPPRDPQIEELEIRVAELERAIAAECRRAEQAVASARAAGRAEATADDAKRIGFVERGMADAMAAWRDCLDRIDGLAATLAAAALAKMFGNSDDLAAPVARTLAHHIERLGARMVVSVGVSPIDFPDERALATLAANAGLATACVIARPELAAGACRVKLRLGEVELDPVVQGAVLADALRMIGETA